MSASELSCMTTCRLIQPTRFIDTIYGHGHRVICRVPYRPNEAPIEFVFDMVACEVRRRWANIQDENELHKNICDILDSRAGLGGFDELFRNCGYV
mmetsp:Transcript_21396/g.47565  ORF Transcript_21396/g.47565 Transcript_21396/m.47565 type:complete len:96 (+) Transcript_21396:922-1209(+)